MNLDNLIAILPLAVLIFWAVLVLLVDLWIPRERKSITAVLTAVGLALSLALTLAQNGRTMQAFSGMVVVDGFAIFLNVIFLASGLAAVALAYDYLKRMGLERGEYYALLLFSICGMMLMAYANDLIIVFLALELLSIPLYVLAGFARPRTDSEESSLKYFLLGAFASGFVLYGVAMIFGATGYTDLAGIVAAMDGGTGNSLLFIIGAVLLLVGFGFKVAAVPFHMWTPDVYQGAPTPISGFMSVAVKAAGFTALLRVFTVIFRGDVYQDLWPVLWGLAALTMIVGNVLAISQKNIKRLLAYSSIAHAGYLLMAFVPYGTQYLNDAVSSTLFYLIGYGFTSFGAWAVVIALEKAEGKGLDIEDYAGLGRRYPWLGLSMIVFMLSFTGIPLTLGFWGKLYLFRTAVEGGYLGLALIGLLTAIVSAYYYLRVLVVMYMKSGEPVAMGGAWINILAVVAAAAVVLLAFIPGPILELVSKALMLQYHP
jgi:NADH-quinone oxidoreductase subunit N